MTHSLGLAGTVTHPGPGGAQNPFTAPRRASTPPRSGATHPASPPAPTVASARLRAGPASSSPPRFRGLAVPHSGGNGTCAALSGPSRRRLPHTTMLSVPFGVVAASIPAWLVLLAAARAVRCWGLAPLALPAGLALLALWPLPLAVPLAYTASLVSLPPEPHAAWHVGAVFGHAAIIVATVAALPHPVTADGAHAVPVVLYARTSLDAAGAVAVALVGLSAPARLHRDVPAATSAVHACAAVAAVSGARKLVGGVLGRDPVAGAAGAVLLCAAGWSFTPRVRPAPPGVVREVVEGPGLYAAPALAVFLALADDGARLEAHQWVCAAAGTAVAFMLQARPARSYLRALRPEWPFLGPWYAGFRPRL